MNEFVFSCDNLTKYYSSVCALSNVTLKLKPGRIVGLLGPNGSGKTTLIKTAAGLLMPTSGSIAIDNTPIGISTKECVSYLPERAAFDKTFTVMQCVQMFDDFFADFDRENAMRMLERFSVPQDVKVKTLSKGTYEKLQLILVMARRAKLYLLDEPIGGVDPAAREVILSIILDNMRPDATIVVSTHLITDIERILDDVVFLRYGRVELFSSADDLRESSGKSIDALFREVFKC